MNDQENVTSSGSEVVSMENSMFAKETAPLDGVTLGQEPTKVETTPQVDEPTIKTPVEASNTTEQPAQVEQKEVEGDTKHSSKVISELGEDRKKILEKFMESAKKSGIAADELKELMANDSRIEKLAKSKFGNDYDKLMDGESVEEAPPVDIEAIKKKAKLEAQLEAMHEEDARLKAKQFDVFAQSYGLNSEEADQLKETAELLEGKYSYEEALGKSLLLVNRDKAVLGGGYQSPSGGQITKAPEPKTTVTPELTAFANKAYGSSRKADEIVQGLDRVAKGLKPDGSYTLSLED